MLLILFALSLVLISLMVMVKNQISVLIQKINDQYYEIVSIQREQIDFRKDFLSSLKLQKEQTKDFSSLVSIQKEQSKNFEEFLIKLKNLN